MALILTGCRTKVAAATRTTAASHLKLPPLQLISFWKSNVRCFASSKHPPRSSKISSISSTGEDNKHQPVRQTSQSANNNNTTRLSNNSEKRNRRVVIESNIGVGKEQQQQQQQKPQEQPQPQCFKNTRKKEWKSNYPSSQSVVVAPVLEPSKYYYYDTGRNRMRAGGSTTTSNTTTPTYDDDDETTTTSTPPRLVLPAMNAAALLDPLAYCKTSAKTAHTHGVNRGISGTDAARRLLRGKKDFLVAARSSLLKSNTTARPALLTGHGIPPKLFQHCIDMADALLLQYAGGQEEDVVECTFHNYYRGSKLPQVLRMRR
jgi:hypothetical protein